MDVLRGRAFTHPRRIAELSADYLIAKRPFAQAVLSLARKGGAKKTLPELLAKLNRIAQRDGIDTTRGPWPMNEDALGKQLSLLQPLLALKRLELIRHEHERPRAWTIPPLLDGSVEPDGHVTAVTAVEAQTLKNPVTSASRSGPGISDEEIQALLEENSNVRPENHETHNT
jgi:hypothetical protein